MLDTRLRSVLVLVAAVAVSAVAALWLRRAAHVYRAERAELDHRVPADGLPPDGLGPAELRDVTWELGGGLRQHAWYIPPKNGALVIYLHGSPGSRASLLYEARALAEGGFGALLVDLPGYGKSAGRRHWDAVFRASTRKAVDFATARPEVNARRIAGMGFSMGSCTLAQVAAEDERVRALILRGAFTRLDEQLAFQFRSAWPGMGEVAAWAASRAGVDAAQLDTRRAMPQLGARPVLLIAGAEDDVIPVVMPERLKQAASNAELWVVKGVGHVGFEALGAPYLERLRAFLTKALFE